jgi:hypothetical protein
MRPSLVRYQRRPLQDSRRRWPYPTRIERRPAPSVVWNFHPWLKLEVAGRERCGAHAVRGGVQALIEIGDRPTAPRANRKGIIFVVEAFQAECDRPIGRVPRLASPALLSLSLRSPGSNAEPGRRFGVLQPCLAPKLTSPVAPPQVYHRSTHQCCSDIGRPIIIQTGRRGEGRSGERRRGTFLEPIGESLGWP